MLIQTRSCPGTLQSQTHDAFLIDHLRLRKLGSRSHPYHGSYLSKENSRFDVRAWKSMSNDCETPPSHIDMSLEDPAIGSCLNRHILTVKKSTKHIASPLPAELIYNGWRIKSQISDESSKIKLRTPLGAMQKPQRPVQSSSRSRDNVDFHGDRRYSTPERNTFLRQASRTIPVSRSTFDNNKSMCMESTKSMQSNEDTTSLKTEDQKTRIGGLFLLNVLAALYGSSNVANRMVADAAPSLPASLTALVRFSAALMFFSPALLSTLRNRDLGLLRAGAELGGLTFALTVVDSCNPTSGSSSSPALLFAFTVIFVPIMEFLAGRRCGSRLTRLASLAAMFGMGVLEEEGFGWKGISCPQIGDLWGVAVSILSAIHIFRSEVHGSRFDALRLNAVQCGVLAILSVGWETFSTFDSGGLRSDDILDQIQTLPWVPLVYNGLVCVGLCSWLELHGLRSIHASTATLVYTTIPVWGALLSFFTHQDTPIETALIGVSIIMMTSIYAQMSTHDEAVDHHQNKNSTSISSTVHENMGKQSEVDIKLPANSLRNHSSGEVREGNAKFPGSRYHHGALLTSQLKFPYYAAQAKRLLAEVKVKIGVMKSLVFTTVSSNMLTTTPTATPSNGNASGGTTPAGPTYGASNLPAHIGTDTLHSATAHHVSSSSDVIGVGLSTIHAADAPVFVHTGVHTLATVAAGLESAIVAVGSDIILGFEEAEDVATFLEHLLEVKVENVAHTVTASMSAAAGWATWLMSAQETSASNFVELSQTQHLLQEALNGTIVLSFPSHLADNAVNCLFQLTVPLLSHLY